MGAAVARHVGARHVVITDMNPERLKLAAEVADVVPVNIKEQNLREVMDKLGMKEGFDVGLEMSGAPSALDQMIDHLVMGGRVALLGVPAQSFNFDLGKIVFRMITLRGIYGREMFETWHKMLAMLESGLDVRKVITRRMKADDYAEAFKLAAGGEKGKIVLEWT
jgi:threonine 3-dehydrogenase